MKIKSILSALSLTLAVGVAAQENPLWMRHNAISPDGTVIAFSYKGDIFTVPVSGGKATQLTTNAAQDSYPVWSPDSKQIVFASAREGGYDLYIMSRDGGVPRRLTTHSGNELPMAFLDANTVLFQANLMPDAESVIFPQRYQQVYTVSTQGGRPRLFSSVTLEDVNVGKDGVLLYHDRKGMEDQWRKHHESSVTRDVWMATPKGKAYEYKQLTTYYGEDRNPVWAPDGQSFYYLSEQKGTFNVFKRAINDNNDVQLTAMKDHPVRFLSVANNGTLCFGYNGELYTLKEGAQPQKVNVTVVTDRNDKDLIRQVQSRGATDVAVSPNGKEVAFIMHGDVYVTSVEYKTTKRITDTPQQERGIDFAPDGRALVYAAERDGYWQIYQAKLGKADEKLFTYATDIQEERLTNTKITSFQPYYSPDGKKVAFLENRTTLRVIDLATKKVVTAMDGKYEYSYSDGDQWFQWSPDSRWLLTNYIGYGGWNNKDVALVNASGNGEIHNLTQSGYNDVSAKWVLDGKAMIFASDRAGYRSHGSWGAEDDVYIMFFDLDAYEQFRQTKEETALREEAEKDKDKEKDDKAADKKNAKDTPSKDNGQPEKKDVEPLKFDLDNCKDRVIRLTVNSSHLADAVLNTKGDKLYYTASFEAGADLWMHDLKEGSTSIVLKNVGRAELVPDKDFKKLYLATQGGIKEVDLDKKSSKNLDFEANFNYRPADERTYLFDHIWQQVLDKFYDVNLHKTDWNKMRDNYRRFLPYINNNYDFAEMTSEMLGELNASHTGTRYSPAGPQLTTASLGLFYDWSYTGDGLKVKEVIAKGPFAVKKTEVGEGSIIEKIDGQPIGKDTDYYPMLDGKAGKPVRVSVYNPSTGKRFDVTVKPVSASELTDLLYKRWVDRNKKLVEKLSGGKVAYVHVRAMDSPSFRQVYADILSDENRQKQAVIVDERNNGGGWLHDDLCTLLAGKEYQHFVPRNQYIGYDPYNKWTKPSCVLICENDYSNGHGFPWVYKTLGIGKLIGSPVAGTMTAVWWETLMDNTLVFGIPQVGCVDMNGVYQENTELKPDITVYNTPEDVMNGYDRQLETAVKEMMKTVK